MQMQTPLNITAFYMLPGHLYVHIWLYFKNPGLHKQVLKDKLKYSLI